MSACSSSSSSKYLTEVSKRAHNTSTYIAFADHVYNLYYIFMDGYWLHVLYMHAVHWLAGYLLEMRLGKRWSSIISPIIICSDRQDSARMCFTVLMMIVFYHVSQLLQWWMISWDVVAFWRVNFLIQEQYIYIGIVFLLYIGFRICIVPIRV